MMKLAQRMVTNFCASISASASNRWTILSALNEIGVRVTVRKSTEFGLGSPKVRVYAKTIWCVKLV
jgi:homeobox-leucine zipper protein